MKNKIKRWVSALLSLLLICTAFPMESVATEVIQADTSTTSYEEISNGYLAVKVSKDNGGFLIDTVEGDRFEKSDNNKFILYPDADYDTSFTTFRVKEDGKEKDYIFGRDYGYLNGNSSSVTVESISASEIISTWSVDDITFTQILNLVGSSSKKHGFVNISYRVETSKDISVSARILMDTALGYQDYATYQLSNKDGGIPATVESEQLLDNTDCAAYQNIFYAYDNAQSPKVSAYLVDGTQKSTADKEAKTLNPTQVAFGHWSHMASTEYDFIPEENLYFTNSYNSKYKTADSAFALYFDLGTIKGGENTIFSTNYGVFSNINESAFSDLTMNITSEDVSMELNDLKDGFMSPEFTISTLTKNISETPYSNILVTVVAEDGISIIGGKGNNEEVYKDTNALNPYREMLCSSAVTTLVPNGERDMSFHFKAYMTDRSGFRKIQICTYRVDDNDLTNLPVQEDMLSSKDIYIYCPTGAKEEIEFYQTSPSIIYSTGTRNVTIYGSDFYLMEDTSRYSVKLQSSTSNNIEYDIPQSNVSVDDETNTIILVLDQEIAPDQYEIVFNYNDKTKNDITSDALRLTVSAKPEYKAESVGVVTIEKTVGDSYEIKAYSDSQISANQELKDKLENYNDELLLKFTGNFSVHRTGENIDRVEAISVHKVDQKATNALRINGCLTVSNGSLIITDEDNVIETNIDANVKTEAGTSVWNGVCAITAIEDGTEYNLALYDIHGDEEDNDGERVTLIWPGAAGGVETIAGFAFNLRYCDFGIIKNEDDNIIKPVISFGAQLDLSFLVPSNLDKSQMKTTPLERAQLKLGKSSYNASELRNMNNDYADDQSLMSNAQNGALAIYVNSLLFDDDGFYGFNVDLDVGIPPYSDAIPTIAGTLHLAIVGVEYAFGLSGTADFWDMGFAVEISFESKNSIPIPDKLSFKAYGFDPGIPVDPYGIVWIQGLGGGVDNMYDTFFGGELVPPATVSMSGTIGIFSALSGTGNVEFGARGLDLSVTNVNFEKFHVLDSAGFKFVWYPSLDLQGTLRLNIGDVIYGNGHLIYSSLADDVELFGKGGIKLPDGFPVLGGKSIANVCLGINLSRVWAGAEAMGIDVGVVYYWASGKVDIGRDVEIGPNLYAARAIPIIYDEENDRTLMMESNEPLEAESIEVVNYPQMTNGVSSTDSLKISSSLSSFSLQSKYDGSSSISTDPSQKIHLLNLGTYKDASDALTIEYKAESEKEAEALAKKITLIIENKEKYDLKWYINPDISLGVDGGLDSEEKKFNETANASWTYNETTANASVTITFANKDDFSKDIIVNTPVFSRLAVYAFNNMPEITSFIYNPSTDTVKWEGTQLDRFREINIYAENISDGSLYQIGNMSSSADDKLVVILPKKEMTSGSYQIKMLASGSSVDKFYSEEIANLENGDSYKFDYINLMQPDTPTEITATPNGDYTIKVSNLATAEPPNGYIINIYNPDGTLTDYAGVTKENTEDGLNTIIVGGQYKYKQDDGQKVTHGLEAGTYQLGVSAYNFVVNDEDSKNEEKSMLVSPEKKVYVNIPLPTEIKFESSYLPSPVYMVNKNMNKIDLNTGENLKIPTFNQNSVTVSITSSQAITGSWKLDDSALLQNSDKERSGVFNDDKRIVMDNLEDGIHKLTITGRNEAGDMAVYRLVFAVDTEAPLLQLYSPSNGGQFDENGTIIVRGVVEAGATLCAEYNGIVKTYKINEQEFTQVIDGLPAIDQEKVIFYARDEVGNESVPITMKLLNSGLTSSIMGESNKPEAESSLALFVDGLEVTNKVINKELNIKEQKLIPKIVSAKGNIIELDETNVEFDIDLISGFASISEYGDLKYEDGTIGTVQASIFNGKMTAMVLLNEDSVDAEEESDASESGSNNSYSRDKKDREEDTKTETIFAIKELEKGEHLQVEIPAAFLSETAFIVAYYEKDGERKILTMSKIKDGKVDFIAPDVGKYYLMLNKVTFEDIQTSWALKYIEELAAKEIMRGISSEKFAPKLTLSRAMVVTMLHRLNNEESPTQKAKYTDVQENAWYHTALDWAIENNIVKGYFDGTFKADESITREQLVTMLYRSVATGANEETLDTFKDNENISAWAREAVKWAVQNGIINGDNNSLLRPLSNCTREEAATIFVRFIHYLQEMR